MCWLAGGGAGGGPAAALPAEAVRRLGLVGHRLRPWPDAAAALAALARRFTVVALSNGNLSMLASVSARGGLTWHAVLSAELVGARKPDPAVYRFALDRLALDPARTLMVAAHPWDLRAAAACGLRTAYIERAGEGRAGAVGLVRSVVPGPGRAGGPPDRRVTAGQRWRAACAGGPGFVSGRR